MSTFPHKYSFSFSEQHEERKQKTWITCTVINTTLASWSSVPYTFPLLIVESLTPEVRSLFIFRIAVNAMSCPLVILLNIRVIVACENSRPSSLPGRVAFRETPLETPLGPGTKKDDCFRRLLQSTRKQIIDSLITMQDDATDLLIQGYINNSLHLARIG